MIWKLAAGFCVATVITQLLVMGVLAGKGNLNGDSMIKIVALANGIDITGDRLRQIMSDAETSEAPSFEEVLQQRAQKGIDMELRLKAQANYYEQIQGMLRDLQERERRFDERYNSFNKMLDDYEKGIQDEGLLAVQRTLETLPPEQAKTQLLMVYEGGEIDTVVNIVQAMSPDKRKKILEEFREPDEAKKLHEILTRIAEGEPRKTLINNARDGGDNSQ